MTLSDPGRLKRVIQDRTLRKFYAGEGVWTVHARDAKVFADLSLAFYEARVHGLTDCRVLVLRESNEIDAQFPV